MLLKITKHKTKIRFTDFSIVYSAATKMAAVERASFVHGGRKRELFRATQNQRAEQRLHDVQFPVQCAG